MTMILDGRAQDSGLAVPATRPVDPRLLSGRAAVIARCAETKVVRAETTRFGTLTVETDLIITLPEGLIGLPKSKDYVVVRQDDNGLFCWFQSLNEPHVALPIVDPWAIRSDYRPTLSDADVKFLELTSVYDTLVFAVVTIPAGHPRGMTANLLAPIVINSPTQRGKQVITLNEEYTTRHLVVDELERAQGLVRAA